MVRNMNLNKKATLGTVSNIIKNQLFDGFSEEMNWRVYTLMVISIRVGWVKEDRRAARRKAIWNKIKGLFKW